MKRLVLATTLGFLALGLLMEDPIAARAEPTGLPEGPGLAAKYPGDAEIDNDSNVVFVENFEEDSLAGMCKRWEDVGGHETMSLSEDVPAGSGGKRSLVTDRQEGSGVKLYRRLKNEAGGWGYDQVFARYYVKFALDCGEIHHFGTNLGGNNPATVPTARSPSGQGSSRTAVRGSGTTTPTGVR